MIKNSPCIVNPYIANLCITNLCTKRSLNVIIWYEFDDSPFDEEEDGYKEPGIDPFPVCTIYTKCILQTYKKRKEKNRRILYIFIEREGVEDSGLRDDPQK